MALARRVLKRAQGVAAPAKLKRAVAAAWVALATSAAPLAAMMALTSVLEGFELVDAAMEPILVRLFEGVGRVGVAYGSRGRCWRRARRAGVSSTLGILWRSG